MIPENSISAIADFAQIILDDPEPEILLSHLAHKTLAEIECRGVILGAVKHDGFLDLLGAYGYTSDDVQQFSRMPLWTPLPITDAARTGEHVILNSPKELTSKYPALIKFENETNWVTIAIPIFYRGVVIGAIGMNSLKAPKNGIESNASVQALVSLCGLYIRNFLAKKSDGDRDYAEAARSLSSRQREIINLFEEELTTDQMADRLRYSPSTIKQDIIKIYGVFGVNSRTAVIELARKAGLIPLKK